MDVGVSFYMEADLSGLTEAEFQTAFNLIAENAPKPFLGLPYEFQSQYLADGFIHQSDNLRQTYMVMNCALTNSALIFGCIGLLAWNYAFPTSIEQLLWRASSVTLIIAPLLWVGAVIIKVNWVHRPRAKKVFEAIMWILLALPYLLGRAFIIFEIFRSLYYLAPDVLIPTWQ
jgi:hypothetical protein